MTAKSKSSESVPVPTPAGDVKLVITPPVPTPVSSITQETNNERLFCGKDVFYLGMNLFCLGTQSLVVTLLKDNLKTRKIDAEKAVRYFPNIIWQSFLFHGLFFLSTILPMISKQFQETIDKSIAIPDEVKPLKTSSGPSPTTITTTHPSSSTSSDDRSSSSSSSSSSSNANANANTNSNSNDSNSNDSNSKYNSKNSYHVKEQIPSKSLIIYTENETANLPEIIVNLLKQNLINVNEWYICGIKNPESFYKSFLLLSKLDFIIKNKTEKKNDVATFKREMAIQYENFYKTLNYRKLRFPRNDMVHNLTNVDNYTEFDALQFIADYSQLNFIILDIIGFKYIDVLYTENTLSITKTNTKANDFVIIIKYASNTYLPLMNSNGNHSFKYNIIDIISKNFERIVLDKLKEPRDCNIIIESVDESVVDESVYESVDESVIECEGHKLIYNIESIMKQEYYDNDGNDGNDGNYDLIKEPIQFYGMKNSIDIDNLITLPTHKYPIEDMIDIGEQDEEPLGLIINKKNSNTVNTTNTTKNITITKPGEPTLKVEKQDSNDLASILSRVPMACDMKQKKGRTKAIVSVKAKTNCMDENVSTNVSTAIPIEELLNHISKTNNVENIANTAKSFREQLKPLAQYNLLDLQMLAKLHKIDTQKMGNCNKKINKLKAELYDDIKDKI